MRLCIVGGALQGMEAVFLARKAGYTTVVIDKRCDAPALSMCDEAHVLDPIESPDDALAIFLSCDAVLPACEEYDLLKALDRMLKGGNVPFLFDLRSYDISQSKIESNELMARVGVPLPRPYPECGFPIVVKPSGQSGSVGVTVAHDDAEMMEGIEKVRGLGDKPVIQEFVHGKSVSIEVIGRKGSARAYVTTEVVLDPGYDCKEVRCHPYILDPSQQSDFSTFSKEIARSLLLDGLMDVEAILTPRGLRFLEIDARIPSQTPAAIFEATGVNLLAELAGTESKEPTEGASIYWHLHFHDGRLETTGEKEFSRVVRPRMESGLFGSDDSISDYEPGKEDWHGTFMVSAGTIEEAESRRSSVIEQILELCGRPEFIDGDPKEA